MKKVVLPVGILAFLVFVFIFVYFETKLKKERQEKGQQLGMSESSDESAKRAGTPWWETKEFMLDVDGPNADSDIYLNGVYTGKRTPARIEVKPDDFVLVRGKPAPDNGVVGAWVINGKEKYLKFSTTEFEKGWNVYADTSYSFVLDGVVFKDFVTQTDFDSFARFGQFRFVTAEKCPNILSISALNNRLGLIALSVSGSAVRDFSAIKTLVDLRSLVVSNTSFSEIEFVSKLTNLTELDLGGTSVSSIEPLSKLASLKSLSIYGTAVDDISPILSHKGLKVLDICSTPAAMKFEGKVRRYLGETYSCACCGD